MKKKLNIQPEVLIVPDDLKAEAENIVLSESSLRKAMANLSTTTSTSLSSTSAPKRRKLVLKCEKCGKKIAEYYDHDPFAEWGAENATATCKTCYQIEKLTE